MYNEEEGMTRQETMGPEDFRKYASFTVTESPCKATLETVAPNGDCLWKVDH